MAQTPTSSIPTDPVAPSANDHIDFENIQGDILFGLPKKHEVFLFFQIRDPIAFPKVLADRIVPLITTTAQVQTDRNAILEHKREKKAGNHPVAGVNIAFSKKGLLKLDIHDNFHDDAFERGQFLDAKDLGDAGDYNLHKHDPSWRSEFKGTIHGVLLFTGDCIGSVRQRIHQVENAFKMDDGDHAVIVEVLRIKGQPRPGPEKGHEHFGYMDGVSQPKIIGVHKPPQGKEPSAIKPGVILLGRDGDIKQGDRPAWAKDSSFLVFRQLNQLVPEWDKFLTDHASAVPGPDLQHRRDLLGARLFGRWKSGAPTDVTPIFDNPHLAKDNDFNFATDSTQDRCPYAAHIRKTNPRSDIPDEFVQRSRMMRTGIPFGPEVSSSEGINQITEHERGLAFVCYQSSIDKGFRFVQMDWCNKPKFPPNKDVDPGFDPIIGAREGGNRDRSMSGVDPNAQHNVMDFPFDFIVPKGGEYFLSPSLAALKTSIGLPSN